MYGIEGMFQRPAAGAGFDPSQHPFSVEPPGLPFMAGVDPTYEGSFRKLPGFRKISTTANNSRIRQSTDLGGASDDNDVTVDYFVPLTLHKEGNPYERRGFVVSAENKLIFHYYDTEDSTWKNRTLCSDVDTQFGTRTDLQVVSAGSRIYVSRKCTTVSGAPAELSLPQVFWWDEDEWVQIGGGIQDGIVYDMVAVGQCLYMVGTFRTVAGSRGTEWQTGGFHGLVVCDGVNYAPMGYVTSGECYAVCYHAGAANLVVGGSFPAFYDLTGAAVSNTKCLVRVNLATGGMVSVKDGVNVGTSIRVLLYVGGNTLFVGGDFTSIGPSGSATTANSVAVNTGGMGAGSTWSALGAGSEPGATVFALEYSTTEDWLIVGGSFSDKIKVYDYSGGGAGWFDVDSNNGYKPDDNVRALKIVGSTLYVGGEFAAITGAGNYAALASINYASTGTTVWSEELTNVVAGAYVLAIDYVDGFLFVGGNLGASVAGLAATDIDGSASGAEIGVIVREEPGGTWMHAAKGLQGSGNIVRCFADVPGDEALHATTDRGVPYEIVAGGAFRTSGYSSVSGVAGFRQPGADPTSGPQEFTARAGVRAWEKPGLDASSDALLLGARGSGLQPDAFYNVRIRYVDPKRGWVGPLSDPVVIHTSATDPQTHPRVLRIYDWSTWQDTAYRPSAIQVWRTIAAPESDFNAPHDGPYFLEAQWPYDPVNAYPNAVNVGVLTDTALENQPQFDPFYDIGGTHGAGPALGFHKNVLYSLESTDDIRTDEKEGSYWDIRWSPPWVSTTPPSLRTETTVAGGFHRLRVDSGDTPGFLPVADSMFLLARNQIVRFTKQGDYLAVNEGPDGLGVCNREAAVAINGWLWFISHGGEVFRMNSQTGALEPLPTFNRWMQTRWKSYAKQGKMQMAYDPASKCVLIAPIIDAADDDAPVEMLVIYTVTGRATTIVDVFPRYLSSGIDPETGRPVAFFVTRNGVILSPSWSEYGVFLSAETENFTTTGGEGQYYGVVSFVPASGTSGTLSITNASFDRSGDFAYDVPCMAYLFKEHPEDATRRALIGIGLVTAIPSTTTITVDFAGNGGRQFGWSDFGDLSTDDGLTLVVAPMVMQVIFDVLRDPGMPRLDDRTTIRSMGFVLGRYNGHTSDDKAKYAFLLPDAVVLDTDEWWYDLTSNYGLWVPNTPRSDDAGTDDNPQMSVTMDQNPDNMSTAIEAAGHSVFPVFMNFDNKTDQETELLGVLIEAMIDKGHAGVTST